MSDNNNFQLTDKLEVFNLLKSVQKAKQTISVSFESLPQYCLTILLEVHHDAEVLIFDECNPQISTKLIENKNEAEFSLKLDNLPVEFTSELILMKAKPHSLYAHFPKEIYYPQNRNSYRYKTEFMNDIDAIIFLPAKKRLNCSLINISANGLCLRFAHGEAPSFQVNNLINDIYIKLPSIDGFSISAKIQYKKFEHKNANVSLGLMIHNQKSSTEKAIQQFIFHA